MILTRLRTLVMAALWASLGLPLAAVGQGGPPRSNDRTGAPRMNNQQPEALERRFHERIDAIVKQRLRLTDDQQIKLREVASRAEESRRLLRREELTLRYALREEMKAGDRANEGKVAELLEQMPKLERRKLDLLESEQRELAKFLTPIQRARYFGLQDELRRGMQDLQRRRMGIHDSTTSPVEARDFRPRGTVPPRDGAGSVPTAPHGRHRAGDLPWR
jgi:protein CpxP